MIVEEQGMGFRTGVRLPAGALGKRGGGACGCWVPFSGGPAGGGGLNNGGVRKYR